MSLTLTALEVAELTGRDRPTAQARVLRAMGIPFSPHPIDGTIKVERAAASAWLRGETVNESLPAPAVNVDAIRSHKHGRKAKTLQ